MKKKILASILALTLISAGNSQTIAAENIIASGSNNTASEGQTGTAALFADGETIEDIKELPAMPILEETQNMKYILKKLSVPHCKRGPERCKRCLETAEPRWCLLDVDPSDKETMQRPVIEIEIDGERQFLVYDVIKSFTSEEEAHQFLSKSDYPGLIWDK